MVSHVFPLAASFSNTVNTMEGNGNTVVERKEAGLFLALTLKKKKSQLLKLSPVAEGLIFTVYIYYENTSTRKMKLYVLSTKKNLNQNKYQYTYLNTYIALYFTPKLPEKHTHNQWKRVSIPH